MIADIVNSGADLVGFTTYDTQLPFLSFFIHDLRRAGLDAHITAGGLSASAACETLLAQVPALDSVVIGEGEASIVRLANHVIRKAGKAPIGGVCMRFGRGIVRGAPGSVSEDLDDLASPALDDFMDGDSAPLRLPNECIPLVASRGCYGRCGFCCIHEFYRAGGGKAWRGRSPSLVVDEISCTAAATGGRRFTFVDENFMGPGRLGRRHAAEIAAKLRGSRPGIEFNFACRANDVDRDTIETLKQAGLRSVTLGIESMSATVLRELGKGTSPQANHHALATLTDLEIFTEVTFIFFTPDSTLTDLERNLEFVDFVRRSSWIYFSGDRPFSEFLPFEGTVLTRKYRRDGLVNGDCLNCEARYRDSSVGFIAARIREVPLADLAQLRALLETFDSPRLKDLAIDVHGFERHLALDRIPELAWDLCRLFQRGANPTSENVAAVVDAFRAESASVTQLISNILAHIPQTQAADA